MRRPALRSALLVLTVAAGPAAAQTATPAVDAARPTTQIPRPANDSLFRRARRMVGEGNGPAGRALVDSLLRAATPGTPAYGDALYWHGALAATASEAERDYRRVIVEYPLAYYADDALLAIAELEQARGDRAAALAHLQRYVRSRPPSQERGIAALGAARLAFEQRDARTGCAMLREARASIGAADVELRNQVEFYASRCRDDVTAVASSTPAPAAPQRAPQAAPPAVISGPPAREPAPATTPVATPTPTPAAAAESVSTMKAPSPYTPPRPAGAAVRPGARAERYTVQLAAYNTRPDAEGLVAKLASRGVKARVSGNAKPFRVRLDYYRTQREAAAVVASLKARGIVGFVTTEVPPAGATDP